MGHFLWLSMSLLGALTALADPIAIPNERLLNDGVRVYRRSSTELWVYDSRPEVGVGAHGADDHTLQMIRDANMRLVRVTMYWYILENTEEPVRTVDIELYVPDDATPIGYEYDYRWRHPWMVIRRVNVDSLVPTVIKMKLPDGGQQ